MMATARHLHLPQREPFQIGPTTYDGLAGEGAPGDEGRDRTAHVLPPSIRDTSAEPLTESLRL
jgi:hypothetical protein